MGQLCHDPLHLGLGYIPFPSHRTLGFSILSYQLATWYQSLCLGHAPLLLCLQQHILGHIQLPLVTLFVRLLFFRRPFHLGTKLLHSTAFIHSSLDLLLLVVVFSILQLSLYPWLYIVSIVTLCSALIYYLHITIVSRPCSLISTRIVVLFLSYIVMIYSPMSVYHG